MAAAGCKKRLGTVPVSCRPRGASKYPSFARVDGRCMGACVHLDIACARRYSSRFACSLTVASPAFRTYVTLMSSGNYVCNICVYVSECRRFLLLLLHASYTYVLKQTHTQTYSHIYSRPGEQRHTLINCALGACRRPTTMPRTNARAGRIAACKHTQQKTRT